MAIAIWPVILVTALSWQRPTSSRGDQPVSSANAGETVEYTLYNATPSKIRYRVYYPASPEVFADRTLDSGESKVWTAQGDVVCLCQGREFVVKPGRSYRFQDNRWVSLSDTLTGRASVVDRVATELSARRAEVAALKDGISKLHREIALARTQTEAMKERTQHLAKLDREIALARAETEAVKEKAQHVAARWKMEVDELRGKLAQAALPGNSVSRGANPASTTSPTLQSSQRGLTRALWQEATVSELGLSPTAVAPEPSTAKLLTWPAGAEVYLSSPLGSRPWERAFLGLTPLRCELPRGRYQLSLVPPVPGDGHWAVDGGTIEPAGPGKSPVPLLSVAVNGQPLLVRAFWLSGRGSTTEQLACAAADAKTVFPLPPLEAFERIALEKFGRARVDLNAAERKTLYDVMSRTGYLIFPVPECRLSIVVQGDAAAGKFTVQAVELTSFGVTP
jgi:hypothetical protein